jgi:hypothetical protein
MGGSADGLFTAFLFVHSLFYSLIHLTIGSCVHSFSHLLIHLVPTYHSFTHPHSCLGLGKGIELPNISHGIVGCSGH